MQTRRVVTGHDEQGRAVVKFDDMLQDEGIPGVNAAVVWTTEGFPVDNTGDQDQRHGASGLTKKNGTIFRLVEFAPGNPARMHRTDSVDYAVIMSGEIDMHLDEGHVAHLKAGDVVVQRGTIHNWMNTGNQPCTIAFILIDARPVTVGDKVLEAHG